MTPKERETVASAGLHISQLTHMLLIVATSPEDDVSRSEALHGCASFARAIGEPLDKLAED